MSTIPSVPPAPTPSAAGGAPQTAVVVPDAPDALRALPNGTRIDVTTLADLVRGQVQADSRFGALTLRGGLPALPANSSLTLILTGTPGDGVSFRLVAINGVPLTGANAPLAGGGVPGAAFPGSAVSGGGGADFPGPFPPASGPFGAPFPAGAPQNGLAPGPLMPGVGGDMAGARHPGSLLQAANQGDAVALSLGKTLSATVLGGPFSVGSGGFGMGPTLSGPGLPGAFPAGLFPPTPPGIAGSGGAMGAAPAGAGAGTGAGAAHGLFAALRHAAQSITATGSTGDAGAGASALPPGAPDQAAPQRPGPFLPGSHLQVRLTGVQLPGGTAALTTPPTPAALASLDGTVTAAPGVGTAVIDTAQGLLLLDVRSPLPLNTRVQLDVLALTPPGQATGTPQAAPTAATPTATALTDALTLLARDDADAAQVLARAIPTADTRLVATMMAVATAARSADPKGWMGERPLKALDKMEGRGRALLKDLDTVSRETTRPARDGGGDWRMLNLPFAFGGMIDRITLVSRRTGSAAVDEDGSGNGGGNGGVRFLFALDLSALGPMQFDGLYKGGAAGQPGNRRLSLLIRTSRPLAPEIRRTILGLFTQSAEVMGLTGTLSFQVSATFPGPEDALPPSLRGGGAGSITV